MPPQPPDPCVLMPTLPPCLAKQAGEVAGSVVNSAWNEIVQEFARGVGEATKTLVTFWTQIPSPQGLGDPGSATRFLQQSTHWYVTAGAVLAVFVAAARMALMQRAEPGVDLGRALVRLVFATFTGVPLIQALLVAGDRYSEWVLGLIGEDTLGARLTVMWSQMARVDPGSGMSSGLLFVVALITLLATLTQILLMLVRIGVVTLLTGLWPLSASMSNTDMGRQWWQRSNGWLLAFVVYKPAAATVYATAFTMMSTGKDLTAFLAGTAMLALAVLTLPALLRLAVPAVAAASAGGGGGLVTAGGGALATGAMATGQLLSGGLGSGGAPAPPQGPAPSGAPPRGDQGPAGGSGSPGGPGADSPAPAPPSPAPAPPSPDTAPAAPGATGETTSTVTTADPPSTASSGATTGATTETTSATTSTSAASTGAAVETAPASTGAASTGAASGAGGAAAAAGPAGAVVTTVAEGTKTAAGTARDLGDEATGAQGA